ncbi:hypothetical protein HGRIS_000739 [Hohenbuehelia grisea]|uniref:Cytochrome P450 n=1 Tax=Hohenbuehelia grisea TaxID=104357 RepID=A0ABR3IPJ8_9AGAR
MSSSIPGATFRDLLWLSFASASCAVAGTLLWRLFLHPLRKVPGPILAATTGWYTAYFDLLKDGGFVEHLEELHRIYGAVIRIGPNELHFNDPKAFLAIYSNSSTFTKDYYFYRCFQQDESSFGMTNFLEAKARRELLLPMFSRRAILRLEDVIREKVDELVCQLASYSSSHAVDMTLAFRALTLDIIMAYCFGHCDDTIKAPEFRHPFLLAQATRAPVCWLFRHIPISKFLIQASPRRWLRAEPQAFESVRDRIAAQVDEVIADQAALEDLGRRTIFSHLLIHSQINENGKALSNSLSRTSLLQEACNLVSAGVDTTANTCTVGLFMILHNTDVHRKLIEELCEAWPAPQQSMPYEKIEKLPYLTAVIKESLRISNSVVTPLPRVVGPQSATILGVCVPAGTTVSMGQPFLHFNSDIFESPEAFMPERWMGEHLGELDSYLAPFSRGPRSCPATNLAWCELYMSFATIIRKLHLKVYETTRL